MISVGAGKLVDGGLRTGACVLAESQDSSIVDGSRADPERLMAYLTKKPGFSGFNLFVSGAFNPIT
jgi:hypothetical protein